MESSKLKQGSNEWKSSRVGRVTGSVAGAILGVDPNTTRDDIMRSMVREYHGAPKEIDEFVENVVFAYGKHHEDGAAIEYQMITGNTLIECGFFTKSDWLGASPDGLKGNIAPGVVEIKCPYGKRNDEKPVFKSILNGDLPHYYAQVQIEMICADASEADFFQWAPKGFKFENVLFDPEWYNVNIPLLLSFYKEYLYERDNDYKKHLDPKLMVMDTPFILNMLKEYDDLSDSIELAKERQKDIFLELQKKTDGKNAELCGRKFTKVTKKGSISYSKCMKELFPDADLEPWRGKPSEYWRLS